MKCFQITISGGDTSKRHLLSEVTVRLNFLILIFSGLNLEAINNHLLFTTVNKKFVSPDTYMAKGINDDKFALNISRLKNNPFSLFNTTPSSPEAATSSEVNGGTKLPGSKRGIHTCRLAMGTLVPLSSCIGTYKLYSLKTSRFCVSYSTKG